MRFIKENKMRAYVTKALDGTVQLWNNKPEFNHDTRLWEAWWNKEADKNEIGIDITDNETFRRNVTFETSPKELFFENENAERIFVL